MELTIKLNLDNDAFKGGDSLYELYGIIHSVVIDTDMFGGIRPMDKGLQDVNGNTVGSVVISGSGS